MTLWSPYPKLLCWACNQPVSSDDETGEHICGCPRETWVSRTVAVNKYHEDYDVDIMRPSIWGNPFRIGLHGNREEVIQMFKERVSKQPHLIKLAKEKLKGKRLGCCCKPLPCHGDVWAEIVDGED